MTPARSTRAMVADLPISAPAKMLAKTTDARVKRVLERVALGELVRRACKAEAVNPRAVYEWRDQSPENAKRYARVREMQVDAIAEDALAIADDASGDRFTDAQGVERPNHEFAARSRLRFDARRWYVAALAPRKYGNHSSLDVTSAGQPITVVSGVPDAVVSGVPDAVLSLIHPEPIT